MHNSSPTTAAHEAQQAAQQTGIESAQIAVNLSTANMQRPEQSIALLEERAIHFGEKRGQYLLNLIRIKPGNGTPEETLGKIDQLDANFSKFVTRYQPILVNDLSLLARESDRARIAQDTVIYEGLKDRFFSLGRELGQSQGRVIDEERRDRAVRSIALLESRLTAALNGSLGSFQRLPDELASVHEPRTALQSALRAALGQGERIGIERRIAAETDAIQIYRNISGWKDYLPTWFPIFKPFHVVHEILRGKEPDQLGYIDSALKDKLGVGMTEALIHAYGKHYGSRVRWLRDGDEIGGAALSAARELGSFFSTKRSRGESIREIYESLPFNAIPQFEALLAGELKINKTEVQDYIASKITPRAAQKIQALRDETLEPQERYLKEQAIHLADLLESKGGRKLQARWVMRGLEVQDLPNFAETYHRQNGQSLKSALETKLPPSAAKDLCLAVIDQDPKRIAASEIKCAFDYRADWIGAPFLRISKEESLFKREAYNACYHPEGNGDFWQDLKKATWQEDYFFLSKLPTVCGVLDKLWWPFTNSYPFLESIVQNGELTRAERLRYYMVGLGTDIDGVYSELRNLTTKEIAETEKEYEARYHQGTLSRLVADIPIVREFFLVGKLRHDLHVELSGDHEFDVSILLEGLPSEGDEKQLCQTKLEHLNRRFHHERSGVLLKNGLLNRWRGDGAILKAFIEDHHNAVSYYRKHIENQEHLAPEHIKRFCTLVRLAETHADAYRDAKVTVSTLVLNSGAFIGATIGAAGVLMFSSLPWWSAAAASGIGSLCWRWAQGNLLLGRGFGKTDATFQAIRAFIDGASMFTVRVGVATLSGLVGRQISSGVAKGGFKTSLHKFIQSVENSIKRQDKARHLIEKGTVMASDAELSALTQGFYNEIARNPQAIGTEKLAKGRKIEDAFLRGMMAKPDEQ